MKHIHIHFHDAFEESKHPRAENGRFGEKSGATLRRNGWGISEGKATHPAFAGHEIRAQTHGQPEGWSHYHGNKFVRGASVAAPLTAHLKSIAKLHEKEKSAAGTQARTPLKTLETKLNSVAAGPIVAIHQAVNDPDLNLISEYGKAWTSSSLSPDKSLRGPDSECHWNTSKLFQKGLVEHVVIGYAKNEEGWHQHTWGLKDGRVIETTPSNAQNSHWFGVPLDEAESKRFAEHVLKPTSAPGNGNVRTVKGGHTARATSITGDRQ